MQKKIAEAHNVIYECDKITNNESYSLTLGLWSEAIWTCTWK